MYSGGDQCLRAEHSAKGGRIHKGGAADYSCEGLSQKQIAFSCFKGQSQDRSPFSLKATRDAASG